MKTIQSKELKNTKSNHSKMISWVKTSTKDEILSKWPLRDLLTKKSQKDLKTGKLTLTQARLKAIKHLERKLEKKTDNINLKYFCFDQLTKKVTDIELSTSWSTGSVYGWQAQTEIKICYNDNTCDYFTGKKIGGCGYDKLSTAISSALNQSTYLKKELYKRANYAYNKGLKPKEVLGYGCGYGATPYFEGGVGENSILGILQKLGFEVVARASHKKFDYVKLTKK